MRRSSPFSSFAGSVAIVAGQPLAFVLACAVIAAWAVTAPIFAFSDTWQLVINTGTTIVTFLMVFLIQNTQNRDGAAIQAKLDELIRAMDSARNEFIGLEHLTAEEVEEVRRQCEADAGESGRGAAPFKMPEALTRSFDRLRSASRLR